MLKQIVNLIFSLLNKISATTQNGGKVAEIKPEQPKSTEQKMSVTLKELLKSADFNCLPKETQDNLMTLLERINRVRSSYGKPMVVTSGLRTMEDHLRIYKAKGITDTSKIPMQSRHLIGAAVDISDSNKELQKWILQNVKLMEQIGLWMEDFSATPNWVHFQIFPPKSGNRFFKP